MIQQYLSLKTRSFTKKAEKTQFFNYPRNKIFKSNGSDIRRKNRNSSGTQRNGWMKNNKISLMFTACKKNELSFSFPNIVKIFCLKFSEFCRIFKRPFFTTRVFWLRKSSSDASFARRPWRVEYKFDPVTTRARENLCFRLFVGIFPRDTAK